MIRHGAVRGPVPEDLPILQDGDAPPPLRRQGADRESSAPLLSSPADDRTQAETGGGGSGRSRREGRREGRRRGERENGRSANIHSLCLSSLVSLHKINAALRGLKRRWFLKEEVGWGRVLSEARQGAMDCRLKMHSATTRLSAISARYHSDV
mmetsp:Transcript_45656/g.138732  ORF Transcript_45656/g.138732 Transcript_45656/m.138732 type:complete len:153 (+) Transcript_45656:1660-2118(+)